MFRKKGFTLIELLVVIAIIALLLSIIMPSLRKAKQMAQTVVCASNLKQWGLGLGAYFSENNDRFFKDYYDTTGSPTLEQRAQRRWHNALWPYVQTEEIFLCPTTKRSLDNTNTASIANEDMTFTAWPISDEWAIPETVGLHGSYGFNAWATRRDYPASSPFQGWNFGKANVQGVSSSSVPVLGDCWWNYNQCTENDKPPAYRGEARGGSDNMSRYCLDRHNENINMLFLDLSVPKVGLKELWTLKWHREYNTGGPWTLADPSSQARWEAAAPWMAGMKAY